MKKSKARKFFWQTAIYSIKNKILPRPYKFIHCNKSPNSSVAMNSNKQKCESRVVNTPVDLFIQNIEIEKYLNYYWNIYFLGNLNKIHLGQAWERIIRRIRFISFSFLSIGGAQTQIFSWSLPFFTSPDTFFKLFFFP